MKPQARHTSRVAATYLICLDLHTYLWHVPCSNG